METHTSVLIYCIQYFLCVSPSDECIGGHVWILMLAAFNFLIISFICCLLKEKFLKHFYHFWCLMCSRICVCFFMNLKYCIAIGNSITCQDLYNTSSISWTILQPFHRFLNATLWMSSRHVNATKSYLHFDRFAGEAILCSNFFLFFIVFRCLISFISIELLWVQAWSKA